MNSQLVDQLRRAASDAWSRERQFERPDTSESDLLTEAADEIERLREEVFQEHSEAFEATERADGQHVE